MNKNITYSLAACLVLLLDLVLAVLTAYQTTYNPWFLSVLVATFILAIVFRHRFDKTMLRIARTLLGALFIFSGFVKGVDPIGTQYQFQDYFNAYGLDWLQPLTLLAAFAMNYVEFIVGILLLLNIQTAITAWIVTLMMSVFTCVTLYDALYNAVPDCGCFGKAITLSNWQTFYKNLIIDALVVIVLFGRQRIRSLFSLKAAGWIGGIVTVLFLAFEAFNVLFLPAIDFLDWKVGAQIAVKAEDRLPATYHYTYKNKQTGALQEFEIKQLPTDLKTNWEYVSLREEDPNPKSIAIPLFDETFNEVSDVLTKDGYTFIFTLYDLEKAKLKKKEHIHQILDFAVQNQYDCFILTDSRYLEIPELQSQVDAFADRFGHDFKLYYSDDKSVKSLIRANPGLIVLHDNIVIGKWNWRCMPSIDKLNKTLKK
ncbi:hypothetical protein FACS1894201_09260 [Bacteroidia bacterium]|nr:hypothetical protein FACS1894201_09260 [Bacteroidia bacterium]